MSTLPLHNICELEPATDVVCDGGYKSLIKSEDFFQLLQVYIDEFERGSKIERPMVALRILEYWRQEKNGRFLKYDDQRDLWNDIGDKKSREYISKALKQITRNSSFASDGGGEGLSREVTTSSISEQTASTETSSLSTATRATSLMSPLPNPFADGGQLIRRVSASVQENTIKKHHLYGRSQEEEDLVALYEHSISADAGRSDFLVLSGDSGVGKTALAKSLQPLVLENNGFFVEAKFEQLTLDDSLAAYISIFSDFCQTILRMHNKDLQKSHVEKITRLMEHFDDSVAVSVVPALGEILKLGPNRTSCSSTMQHDDLSSINEEVDGSGEMIQKQEVPVLVSYSSARLKFCFSKILRSIVSQQHPLVVVLDDIQYASSVVAFGDFLTDMISHREGLFFIATNRCPKALCFDQFTSLLSRDVVKIHQWNVSGLTLEAVHELIADALSLDAAKLETLSSHFFHLTGGNALFLLELLRAFQEDDILRYDESTDQWKCDDHLLTHHPLLQVHSLSELYCARILDLPKLAQDTLKLASVLGPCFSEEIVAKVSKSKESAYHLQLAIEAGLLNRKEEGPLAFRHDSIHTATYNLIPDEEKSAFTLQLGTRLWRKVGEKDINKYSFDIVRLLFRAQVELFQKSSSADLAAIALLCLEASKIAAKSAGFHACIFYVEFGIRILEELDKWRDHYDLCLALHNNAVDVYYGVGQFDKVDKFVDEILANARSFEHTVQARMMRVYTLGTKKKLIDALDYGVETLSLLGDPIPSNPTKLQVALAVSQTKRRLSKKSDAALLRIPTLTDEKKLAVMMTLQILFLNAYNARPSLAVLISCRIIDITLKHGACAVSSVGFGGYGVVISRGGINFEDAYRFGQNALAISNKFGGEVWECRAAAAVYGCINIWKEPIQQCLHQSKKAYLLGLGSGDIEYSILNASLFVWNGFDSMPLDHLDSAMRNLYERMVVLKQEKSLVALKPVWQMCQNFMGRNDGNPKVLLGECLTQEDLNDTESIDCHFGLLNSLAMYEMLLAYHFSDFKRAETKLLAAERVYENMSTLGAAYARMYHALTLLATAKKSDWKRIRQVRRHLKVMRVWSLSCPENFLGKQLLVEAELAAVLKKRKEAYSKYYLAIIQSRDSGMIMQEALANERAGKFCASIGDKETARKYFNEALRLYKAWGGTAKYKHLEAEIRWTIMCFTCN